MNEPTSRSREIRWVRRSVSTNSSAPRGPMFWLPRSRECTRQPGSCSTRMSICTPVTPMPHTDTSTDIQCSKMGHGCLLRITKSQKANMSASLKTTARPCTSILYGSGRNSARWRRKNVSTPGWGTTWSERQVATYRSTSVEESDDGKNADTAVGMPSSMERSDDAGGGSVAGRKASHMP